MTAMNRRALMLGLAATCSATVFVSRAYAQAPAGPFKLDPLPYPANKNEPHIDTMTMEIHHGRHRRRVHRQSQYRRRQYADLGTKPLHEIVKILAACPRPCARSCATAAAATPTTRCSGRSWADRRRAGGRPQGCDRSRPGRHREAAGSFNAAGGRVFGSAGSSSRSRRMRKLAIESKPNQDTPIMDGKMVLMGNDVWEHAYYLKYQNRRADISQVLVERARLEQDRGPLRRRQSRQADDLSGVPRYRGISTQ